ncbi:MAG TPA: hypothetical protein PLG79_11655 [Spirochaetales bacterium]|nr:hypothetical protein [Spirochaetales bacterium]HOV39372.1 hypothetical protein [Spirochaetales bacterium]
MIERILFVVVWIFFSTPFLRAASPEVDVKLIRVELQASLDGYKTTQIDLDRNNDGKTDHILLLDEKGQKLFEELDYNFDLQMDDFCLYEKGVLVKELIDTNFDGKIDMWVYIQNGVYIERYERDTDFNGIIDKVKQFGQKK